MAGVVNATYVTGSKDESRSSEGSPVTGRRRPVCGGAVIAQPASGEDLAPILYNTLQL